MSGVDLMKAQHYTCTHTLKNQQSQYTTAGENVIDSVINNGYQLGREKKEELTQ